MATVVSGTFSATGTSSTIVGRKIHVKMDFGTATVQIQEQLASTGNWIQVGSDISADSSQVLEYPTNTAVRLNCSAYTSSTAYELRVGVDG